MLLVPVMTADFSLRYVVPAVPVICAGGRVRVPAPGARNLRPPGAVAAGPEPERAADVRPAAARVDMTTPPATRNNSK